MVSPHECSFSSTWTVDGESAQSGVLINTLVRPCASTAMPPVRSGMVNVRRIVPSGIPWPKTQRLMALGLSVVGSGTVMLRWGVRSAPVRPSMSLTSEMPKSPKELNTVMRTALALPTGRETAAVVPALGITVVEARTASWVSSSTRGSESPSRNRELTWMRAGEPWVVNSSFRRSFQAGMRSSIHCPEDTPSAGRHAVLVCPSTAALRPLMVCAPVKLVGSAAELLAMMLPVVATRV